MHAPDAIIDVGLVTGGFVVSGGVAAWSLMGTRDRDIPRIAVTSAMLFVTGLIHVPALVAGTSIHLLLNGLAGVLLGRRAFIAVAVGVVLQTLIFQHGGLTTIGFNAAVKGLPALLAGALFRVGRRDGGVIVSGVAANLRSALAGGGAVILSAVLLALGLWFSGRGEFELFAKVVVLANLPVAVLEGTMTVLVVRYLARVQPQILRNGV